MKGFVIIVSTETSRREREREREMRRGFSFVLVMVAGRIRRIVYGDGGRMRVRGMRRDRQEIK